MSEIKIQIFYTFALNAKFVVVIINFPSYSIKTENILFSTYNKFPFVLSEGCFWHVFNLFSFSQEEYPESDIL